MHMSEENLLTKEEINSKEDEQITEKEKTYILVACLISLTIGNMMINNVIAVLPNYISSVDWDLTHGKMALNESDISLILAIFSIA